MSLSSTNQILYIVDVQDSFAPPEWLVADIQSLVGKIQTVATVEHHDEQIVPFRRQLDWSPNVDDECLVAADKVFVKYGYSPPTKLIETLVEMNLDRVLVCGLQAETCVLAAGFVLFDAGLHPTLIESLTVGSSLDPSGTLGRNLWKHHFGLSLVDQRGLFD